MSLGPVEILAVKFPGNKFKGEIVPAIADLVDKGTIRIIDIVFVNKDADGKVETIEINDLEDEEYKAFDPLVSDVSGLLSPDDIQAISEGLEDNSSGAVMLFENTWATAFADAVRNAEGQVVLNERIPRQVIEEVLAATPQ